MQGRGSSNAENRETRVPNTGVVTEENVDPQQTFKPNPNRYVPISSVTRIMRRGLPPHARIADDAKEIVQECVTEFISFVTNEANDKCRREWRKTISANDIISAMRSLGFNSYIEPLTTYLNNYRAQDQVPSVAQHHAPVGRDNTDFIEQLMTEMIWSAPPPLLPPPAAAAHSDAMDGVFVDLSQTGDNCLMGNVQGGGGCSSMGM